MNVEIYYNFKPYQLLLNQLVNRVLKLNQELKQRKLKVKLLLNKVIYTDNSCRIHYGIFFCLAKLRAQAAKIEADNELHRLTEARELELSYSKLVSDLEIDKAKRLGDIETKEFKEHVNAIGKKTIQAIATSGPDNQVKSNFDFYYKSIFIFLG